MPGAKRNAAPDNSLQLRGPIVAISPWNFPLAIFVGQIAAALAAGSPVLAKPAEQTPLIAHAAICVLHAAGVPRAALQLLPGNGETIGAALVADSRIRGVLFTGSTEVARLINRQLAMRDDDPILIAETGGQNAMIVDSSALPEQVVADALLSAFDSAGQRCSALRVLCLQDDIADTVLTMLIGAMNELRTGDPRQLATDVGPVIDAAARTALLAHVERMRSVALPIMQASYSTDCANGTFMAPTVIDLGDIDGLRHLQGEVFGPLLHVLRWQRDELTTLIDRINATGYGLTHGIATRVDTTITTVLSRIRAGNVYVNRNIVGAVVGVQPFGGCGLSGTGPKAGGPFYLTRLMHKATPAIDLKPRELPGPTGETNTLQSLPRGIVACIADSDDALIAQGLAAYACGNSLQIQAKQLTPRVRNALRHTRIDVVERFDPLLVDAVLLNTDPQRASAVRMQCAATPGPILPVVIADANGDYDLTRLIVERTVTVNTAATGGNTALLSLDED